MSRKMRYLLDFNQSADYTNSNNSNEEYTEQQQGHLLQESEVMDLTKHQNNSRVEEIHPETAVPAESFPDNDGEESLGVVHFTSSSPFDTNDQDCLHIEATVMESDRSETGRNKVVKQFETGTKGSEPMDNAADQDEDMESSANCINNDDNNHMQRKCLLQSNQIQIHFNKSNENLLLQAYLRVIAFPDFQSPSLCYSSISSHSPPSSSSEFVIISGPTGVGKTTLAQSLRDRVISDGGFFCQGKFDSLHSTEPYAAFVTAFTEFTDAVLARGEAFVASMRDSILAAVGSSEGQVLTDTIPALSRILGDDHHAMERSHAIPPSGAVNQFSFLFRMFVRAVCSPEQPLVLFLDDIHYADESSMILLMLLATDVSNKGILIVTTVREDAIPCRKLEDGLERLRNSDVRVTRLELQNLAVDSVGDLLSQMLRKPLLDQIQPLANIIHLQTEGNLFYIFEMVRSLQQDDLLLFDSIHGNWTWDEHDIQLTIQQTTLNELITDRMFQLPQEAQQLLKVAACLGSKLNFELLTHVISTPIETYVEIASKLGLLVCQGDGNDVEFAHDRIRETIYNLISDVDKTSFHLEIGRALNTKVDNHRHDDAFIFVMLGQLELGAQLIHDQQERIEVAALCLRGGTLAVRSSCFKTASRYYRFGIRLLDDMIWRDEYEMCMELHNCATEVEYCNGHFESLDALVANTISKSHCYRDTLRVRTCQVYSFGGRNIMSEAVGKGLDILQELGETFPNHPNRFDWFTAFRRTRNSFRLKSPEAILRLPLMRDQDKLAAMQLMNLMFSFAFTNKPFLAPLLACRMVDLTLEHGLCAVSSPAMMMFASLLIRWGGRVEEGCQCGKLAFGIYEKFGERAWWGRICAGYYSCVCGWTQPMRDGLPGIKNAHRIALETGDIEIAMINANLYCWTGFGILPISELEKEIRSFVDHMEFHGQKSTVFMILPLWQLCENLLGKSGGDPNVLTGTVIDQEEYLNDAQEKNPHSAIWFHFNLCLLAYLFGDYEAAEDHGSQCRILQRFPFCSFTVVSTILFNGLAALALYRNGRKHRRRRLGCARQCLKSLKLWSRQAPINFLGHLHLLKAELAATIGDHDEAASNFTCAIALTCKTGNVMLEALANELAGRYFVNNMRNPRIASGHFQEAYRLYNVWGGHAKADQLKKEIER